MTNKININDQIFLDNLINCKSKNITEKNSLLKVIKIHPVRVSSYYLSLIDSNDPFDPIAKMALPSVEELDNRGSYDTSGEIQNTKMEGLQHKYSTTALILATNKCSVYCRHCFRKRLVGLSDNEVIKRLDEAFDYIAQHKEINNILITGGDPLMLPTSIIQSFIDKLYTLENVDFIRIGTRIPVTDPTRLLRNKSLIQLLSRYTKMGKRMYIVTQVNHPRELTPLAKEAFDMLIDSGVIISNQAVLLKGVNDSPEILIDLFNGITRFGIVPYYLFQCRPVRRVKNHFQVPLLKGYEIIETAKRRLNGHSKRFRYIMSHRTGKIEIIGIIDDEIILKYHQAKNPNNFGKIIKRKIRPYDCWYDELQK